MLKSKSLFFNYDTTNKFNFPDIKLKKGDSLLILGESGVGKTTFIHILAGLLRPSSGIIELNGVNYHDLNDRELDLFRGENIGMIFQKPYFVRNLSIYDNLLLALYLSKKQEYKKNIKKILHDIGLANKLNYKPDSLSQGEQQRVAIALAVVKRPSLILADEPTSSLDDKNCNKIIALLKKQAEIANSQLVIITHDKRLKDKFNKSITL